MTDIGQIQNLPKNLNHLVASRVWYRRGRRVALLQILLAFSVPLVSFAVVVAGPPEWKVWTSTAGISVTILDSLLLDRLQRQLRANGANEQEMFDCLVLGLQWPSGIAGSKPTLATTNHVSAQLDANVYRDWYPPVKLLSSSLAALICQQCNAWWDAKLRSLYTTTLSVALILVTLSLLIIAMVRHLTFEQSILLVYAPLSPMLIWTIRELFRHYEVLQISLRTEKLASYIWNNAVAGTSDDIEASTRDLQNAIYSRRRTSPFIPTVFQNMQQQKYLRTIKKTAEDQMAEAQNLETAGLRADSMEAPN